MSEILKFTIPIKPITKKNSQRIITNPRTGRPMILPSKAYKDYEANAWTFLRTVGEPIDYPINVEAVFFLPTRTKTDLVNLQEALLDVMVKGGVIADDNYTIVWSMDGSRVHVDKANPRTEVTITKADCVGDPRDGQMELDLGGILND